MRNEVGVVLAVVLGCAVVAAAPAEAIDLEQVRALKEEARAAMLEMQRGTTAEQAMRGSKPVVVRCDHGQSVQRALDKNSGPVVIEIQGICAENVRIEHRNDVILLGADPTVDGVRGVEADPPRDAAVEILYSNRVRIENLSVSNSPSIGLGLWYAEGEIVNCRFSDNANAGLHVSAMSYVVASEVQASGNGGPGINVKRNSQVICQACDLVDNEAYAVTVNFGGFLTLWDGVVSGQGGLWVSGQGSYADLDCFGGPETTHGCSLTGGDGRSGWVGNGGVVGFISATFEGPLRVVDGRILLQGAQQAPLPENKANVFLGSSEFHTLGWWDKQESPLPALLSRTSLAGFTRARFEEGTEFSSVVLCSEAADALVLGSVDPAGMVVDCPHVPVP